MKRQMDVNVYNIARDARVIVEKTFIINFSAFVNFVCAQNLV